MLYIFFSTQPAKPAQRETTMSSRLTMGLAAASVLALAAAPFAATPSLARDRAVVTTEFSAQSEKEKKDQRFRQRVYSEINFSLIVKNAARKNTTKNFTISLG